MTVIGVLWCFSAPFWPTNAVGISRAAGCVVLMLRVTVFLWPLTLTVTFFLTVVVFVIEQRLPLAARAE